MVTDLTPFFLAWTAMRRQQVVALIAATRRTGFVLRAVGLAPAIGHVMAGIAFGQIKFASPRF